MTEKDRKITRFTPSVSEGFLDINPEMTIDFLAGLNPFDSTAADDIRIRSEIKPEHIEELADYLLKGGNYQFIDKNADMRKTYQNTDNPLIKETIMHGPNMISNRIIRNNFYGLNLDDRKLISESYQNLLNREGTRGIKESDYSKETKDNLKNLKNARKKFKAGDIKQSEFDSIRGSLIRNLQEENTKAGTRTLFSDPNKIPASSFYSPYQGRGEETIEAASSATFGPFAGPSRYGALPRPENYEDLVRGGPQGLQALANLQAQYGFEPQLKPWNANAPITGYDRKLYDPTEVFEYYDDEDLEKGLQGALTVKRYMEGDDYLLKGARQARGRTGEGDRLTKVLTGYQGPEGTYYDADQNKFYRDTPIYGEPTFVPNRYQYDPRFIQLLESTTSPEYAEQFRQSGGITNFNKGGTIDIQQQTKNVAAQGRYGDSMLLHVNPAEVKGLAQAMPITVNPQTGQPEAFLPFLAPIIGSMLGGSLLTGATVGGMALSKAAAAGIGAGLAQTAVTGSVKEGFKAGLTAGMGSRLLGGGAEAQKLAEGTQAATTEATNIATADLLQNPSNLGITDPNLLNIASTDPTLAAQLGPEALTDTARIQLADRVANSSNFIAQGGKDAVAAYSGDIPGPGAATFKDDFSTVFSDGVGQGFSNIGSAAMKDPLALATLGTTGTMYGMDMMQADYEEQMRRMEEERLERKRQNELMNPEPILYSAEGGITGYDLGGMVRSKFGDLPDNIGGDLPQIYAPARQPYQINPDFMPGFAPETMYFRPETLSAPASGLQAGGPPVNEAVPYAGSQGGYGGRQAYIAPQVSIDPYAAYTGEAPEGLKFGKPPRPVFERPELPDQGLVNPGLPDFGTGPVGLGGRIGIPNIGDLDIQSIIDSLDQYNIPEREIGIGDFMNQQIIPPRTLGEPLPKGVDNNIDISQYLGSREDNLETLQTMFGPQVEYATNQEPSIDSGLREMMSAEASMASGITPPPKDSGLGEMMTAEELIARGGTPQPIGSGIFGKGPIIYPDLLNTPVNLPEPLREEDVQIFEPPMRDRKAGGDTLKAIPEDNKGLSNLPKDVRNKMGYMQAGGNTDIMNDPLTQEVTLFLLGESNDERPLNEFLTKYGNEAFMQLREAVLQSIVPNAQTEGLIKGDGEGGMDDDLRGMIGDKERIAVSQDEFIVPADVVSMLGDGSSNAGSKELYDMMDRVRQTKTGTTKQAPRLANAGGLLPA
jgi:hypothetical protein|tara:strand:- start:1919 stop:5569 length:3651 start_codon:yes stop_codon:yes gene_type:complete